MSAEGHELEGFDTRKEEEKHELPPPPSMLRACSAEFVGTFVLISFGCGVNAQTLLGKGESGGFLSVAFGWAMGIMFGAYSSAGVSGGHMNPAVTLALAFHRQFPWIRVLPYMLAQVLGAFCASALVYVDYRDALTYFDGGNRTILGPLSTAGIWATYPSDYLSVGNGFYDQMVGTGFLLAGIFALNDEVNAAPDARLRPVLAGMLVFAIGCSFGMNDGYAINPARDLGPRLFTTITHGAGVWDAYHHWWWVPLTAPFLGALVGSTFYLLTVRYSHHENPFINLRIM